MNQSDQFIKVALIALISIYLLVWVLGLILNKAVLLITLLNIGAGVLILIYWIQKQIRIEQHVVDWTEVLFLCLEFLAVVSAFYSIINNKLKLVQYVICGIHLLLLVAFFIFMLTFKINKLI